MNERCFFKAVPLKFYSQLKAGERILQRIMSSLLAVLLPNSSLWLVEFKATKRQSCALHARGNIKRFCLCACHVFHRLLFVFSYSLT